MEFSLARHWWVVALRGALAIAFGVMAFVWPAVAWYVVVILFGAYALVDGVFALVAAVTRHGGDRPWWSFLVEGVIGIAAGLLALFWPEITQLALLYVVAGWAVATGVFEIAAAVRLREHIEGEWLLGLSGVLSILFGLALGLLPGFGLLALAWLVGLNSIAFGVLLLVLAFRLRARRPADAATRAGPGDLPAGSAAG